MKKISTRVLFPLLLAAVLLAGLIVFAVRYCAHAGEWVTFPGSPHVYSGINLNQGVVTDRSGVLLLDSTNGRVYSDDPAVRSAAIHLLGDRYGYISAPLVSTFAEKMLDYNKISGLYGQKQTVSTAVLTLSARVQKAAAEAMSGKRGVVAVYNYKTGEILCALSSPNYDPDHVPDIEHDTTGAYSGVYVNRFFASTYTPGSVFKLVTAAAALETIPDIEQQTFECTGSCIIGGQKIVCEGKHGTIGLAEGLAKSCNCVFGQLAEQLGAKTLQKYADRLGINSSFECDGCHAVAGSVDLKGADAGDVAWAGIGQYTDQVNAYAFLRFLGAAANGGSAAEPYLMQAVRKESADTYTHKTDFTGKLLKESTAGRLSEMMRDNVVNIYGAGQFAGLTVCAKSGTAEIEGQTPHAMFAGFATDEQYPLAFVVFVENAGAGSAVAAPIAASVLHACVDELQN